MKDYSFGEDKNFIKKFKVKGNIIKVYRVGKTEKIPYSKENVDMLLEQMKDQHNTYNNNVKEVNKRENKIDIPATIFCFLSLPGATIAFIVSMIITKGSIIAAAIFSELAFVACLFPLLNIVEKRKRKIEQTNDDCEKNEYFFEHEEEFKENSKEKVKEIISKKRSIKPVLKTIEEPVVNINTIRNMSLDELKSIKAYINQVNVNESTEYAEQESGFTQVRRNIKND